MIAFNASTDKDVGKLAVTYCWCHNKLAKLFEKPFESTPPEIFKCPQVLLWASLEAQRVKRLPTMQETQVRSLGQEDSPGEGNGNPLQYCCLENPMDGGAWWATVHGVAKSRT